MEEELELEELAEFVPAEFNIDFGAASFIMLELSPTPKARPRLTRSGHVYTPKKTKDFETDIRNMGKVGMMGRPPLKGPIAVRVDFYIEKPKTVRRELPFVKPDIDNLLKSVLDGLNEVCWVDDAQICHLTTTKTYGDNLITVLIAPIDDGSH